MKNIIEIDISENNYYTSSYGKVNGWVLCKKLGLPTFSKLYMVKDYIDVCEDSILSTFGKSPLLCRTDAPWGHGNKLPRGRNVTVMQINNFLKEIKQCTSKGVVLIYKNPYGLDKQEIIPRYELDGGIFVLFEFDRILVEHVGKGFDVGDITRGKTVHNSIVIPNCIMYDTPYEIFKYSKVIFPDNFYTISSKDYKNDKINRENELVYVLNEQSYSTTKNKIPDFVQPLTLDLFKKIYQECIEKVIYTDVVLRKPFGIMMNLFHDVFCIFEVWQERRSLPVP